MYIRDWIHKRPTVILDNSRFFFILTMFTYHGRVH